MKPSRETAKLTSKEQKYLQSLILGYGMLKIASDKSEVPVRTLHNIARIGHGSVTYIELLRSSVLAGIDPKVETNIENANQAA